MSTLFGLTKNIVTISTFRPFKIDSNRAFLRSVRFSHRANVNSKSDIGIGMQDLDYRHKKSSRITMIVWGRQWSLPHLQDKQIRF